MDAEDDEIYRLNEEEELCLARHELFQARERACFHLGIYSSMLKDYKEEPEMFSALKIKNAIENAKRLEDALYRLELLNHTSRYDVMKEAFLVHVLCTRMNAAHVGLFFPDILTEDAYQGWLTFIQGQEQVDFQVKWNIIHAIIGGAYKEYKDAYANQNGDTNQDWLWSIIPEAEARRKLIAGCRQHRHEIKALGNVVAKAFYPVEDFRICALEAQQTLPQIAVSYEVQHELQQLFTDYLQFT